MQRALAATCHRGNFVGAAIADSAGLALAAHNPPVDRDALAAFSPFMGDLLSKAVTLFQWSDADSVIVNVDQTHQLVLRRFYVDGRDYFLSVITPRQAQVIHEIEFLVQEIHAVLVQQ